MNALLWLASNKALVLEIFGAIGVIVSTIIGALPSSASRNSKLVEQMGRSSFLTHSDAPGTFKLPGAAMPVADETSIVVNVNGVEMTTESIEAALRGATKRTPPGGAA
jgi:hypothetical protein